MNSYYTFALRLTISYIASYLMIVFDFIFDIWVGVCLLLIHAFFYNLSSSLVEYFLYTYNDESLCERTCSNKKESIKFE